MPLETIFQELPKAAIAAGAEVTLKLTFSQAVKLLELSHSAGVTLKHVQCADKTFEGESYKNEIVPGNALVLATLENKTDKEIFVRAGWYVETEKSAALPAPAPAPTAPAAVEPASVPTHYVPQVNPNDPYAPPPPGASKSFQMGDQSITVTTPANGAPHPGPFGHTPPAQAPGTVESYQMGNQQIRVSAPAAHAQTAHSEVVSAVVAPKIRPGPQTVTVGMDEVAILMKRSEAENMLKILNGAIMHPAFCTPIIGAVQRALGA